MLMLDIRLVKVGDKMSLESARKFLEDRNLEDHIIELEESTATVSLAAQVLGVTEGEIAKSLTFWNKDKEPILILMAGDKRVDNKKLKTTFNSKMKMIDFDHVEEVIGHKVGGVCPFGVKDEVKIYLDKSLRDYERVYPSCGSEYVVAEFSVDNLESIIQSYEWVDITK